MFNMIASYSPRKPQPMIVRGLAALALLFVLFSLLTNTSYRHSSHYPNDNSYTSSQQQTLSIEKSEPVWKPIKIDDVAFQTSSYECTNDKPVIQTCMFKNIALHLGQLYYIKPEGTNANDVPLPDPTLFEVFNSPSNAYSISKLLQKATSTQLKTIILNSIQAHTPQQQPQYLEFQVSAFTRTRTFDNWFWMMNGAGQFYHRFCKYFGACDLKSLQATALLHPQLNSTDLSKVGYTGLPDDFFTATKDLFKCFGTMFWVNHGDNHIQTDARFEEKIVVLRNMLAGVGPDIVHPRTSRMSNGKIYYEQASNEIALKRVRYLRQCAGLNPDPPQRTTPRVMLLNRPYTDGRHILGLDDVFDRLKRQLGQSIDIDIYLPRGGQTLHEQASAFDSHDVVVLPHGAANGNVNFLPYNSVVIMVYALNGRFQHEKTLVESLPSPPYNMDIIPIDCSKRTEGRLSGALEDIPEFQTLDPAKQIALLNADMSGDRKEDLEGMVGLTRLDWMSYKSYRPDTAELASTIIDALKMWADKSQAHR